MRLLPWLHSIDFMQILNMLQKWRQIQTKKASGTLSDVNLQKIQAQIWNQRPLLSWRLRMTFSHAIICMSENDEMWQFDNHSGDTPWFTLKGSPNNLLEESASHHACTHARMHACTHARLHVSTCSIHAKHGMVQSTQIHSTRTHENQHYGIMLWTCWCAFKWTLNAMRPLSRS